MKKMLLAQTNSEDENDFVFSLDDKKTLKQLEWEGDDEFSLNGEMYDVIEMKIENNKLIVRCLNDKKETALLNKLKDNWRENERSNKIVNELFQLLQALFYHSKSEGLAFIETTRNNFDSPSEQLSYQIKKVPTPPPQAYYSNFGLF